MATKTLSLIFLCIITIICFSLFFSYYGELKNNLYKDISFEKSDYTHKNNFCKHKFNVNYDYNPTFEENDLFCSSMWNGINYIGFNEVNETEFFNYMVSDENEILSLGTMENILDNVLFFIILSQLIFSLVSLLFSEKINSFKILIYAVLGIPLFMLITYVLSNVLKWMLFDLSPYIIPNFTPNFPKILWILDNLGIILLFYICFYIIALSIEYENVKEQSIHLYNEMRRRQ